MILFDVIGWQRGLLGISLAVVYFLLVSLINFSPCQKANCVLFVSGGVVGEFTLNHLILGIICNLVLSDLNILLLRNLLLMMQEKFECQKRSYELSY